jgi:PhoH-like ATPase
VDPRILCTTLLGPQGAGKTLVPILAGLDMIRRHAEFAPEDRINQIVYIRAMVPAGGVDIGALPGDGDEKFAPWSAPLEHSLEAVDEIYSRMGGSKNTKSDLPKLRELCRALPVTHIDGVSFHHSFVIVDEAEYMDRDLLKQLLTRAGTGTRYALSGSLVQGGERVNPRTCGLRHTVMRTLKHENIAHIVLNKCERSKLASIAVDLL